MTKYEKLLPFCSTEEKKPMMHNVFSCEGFGFATDGRIMVRTSWDESLQKTEPRSGKIPACMDRWRVYEEVFNASGGPQWRQLGAIQALPDESFGPCSLCFGHGFEYQTTPLGAFEIKDGKKLTVKCTECGGTGEESVESPPVLATFASQQKGMKPAHFNVAFLHMVKALGEKIEVAILNDVSPMWFRVDDGEFEGMLMPYRQP